MTEINDYLKQSYKNKRVGTLGARQRIDGTSLTASYQQVFTSSIEVYILFLFNSCDTPILVSLDGGTTDHFEFDSDQIVIDLRYNDLGIENIDVQVKHSGAVPTAGSFRVTAFTGEGIGC